MNINIFNININIKYKYLIYIYIIIKDISICQSYHIVLCVEFRNRIETVQ